MAAPEGRREGRHFGCNRWQASTPFIASFRATVVVLPSGHDKIIKRFPNPAYESAATSLSVQATGASMFRWGGDFWFNEF